MQQQNLSIKTFVSKHKKVLIATVLSLILVVVSAISLTLALFNDREDRTININFHNETVTIDAEIDPSEQMFSSDVTLLKLFQPSDEVPLVHLLNSAQVTILLSDYEALGVRFKIGFEYHDNTSVSNETLKLIQSYLNNSVDFSSLISATPYLTYSWKQINKASGDNYYYLCNSSSNQVYLNTTTQSYSLNVVDGVVNYSGLDALNLDINSLPNDIKAIFEKLSLTLQIEVCPQGSSYEFLSPTYTYGKVALFDAQGGSETPAKLLSGNNLTLPTTSKLGQVFGGWCDSPALTNIAGQANASITQSNSVQTYYA